MAHNPVGSGASFSFSNSSASVGSTFAIQSDSLRVYADTATAFVAITTGGADATNADYVVPAGEKATLYLKKATGIAVSIAEGDSSSETVIKLPEGVQCPFVPGEYVTVDVDGGNDANWATQLSGVLIKSIASPVSPVGYNQPQLTVDADVSGISTAYNGAKPGFVRKAVAVSAIGLGAGALYYQQVQISGDA
tara:strand:+ start:502 stop:1080 length:579 start_codon:yes stop_codon:yes gene_type:complete